MTRLELYELEQGISNCKNLANKDTIEFVYRLALIHEAILKFIKLYENVRPANTDEYQKYIDAKTVLIEEYAVRDENGQIVSQGMNIALRNSSKYKQEILKLDEEFKNAIDKHKIDNDKFEKFLNDEETAFTFQPIPKKHIPTTIQYYQMRGILPIIEKN